MTIRTATPADGPALGRLGALLMRVHYDFDRTRFLAPQGDVEAGYGAFLLSQLDDEDSIIFVADEEGQVVGYCYAGIEPMSWKELRDTAGFIHDIAVAAGARRNGIANALADAAISWFRARGLARVMLWTAAGNLGAQALFERAGFRHTMSEMTLDL
jgi:ribosomal protein S18 acetylase RimI-like enzyme